MEAAPTAPAESSTKLLELKARCSDINRAQKWVEAHGQRRGKHRQVDTYFRVSGSRLKLREVDGGQSGTLIHYFRDDEPGPKKSRVRLLNVSDAPALKELLSEALGTLIVVEKTRAIYRVGKVQIHIDEVEGLGAFVEFERVITSPEDEEVAQAEFSSLRKAMAISEDSLVAGSYSDPLLGKRKEVTRG